MIKLKIVNIDGYKYNLEDEDEHNYIINLEFFDVEEKLKIGNYIYINRELLNSKYEGYSTSYTFGSLENKYGKENISIDDIDVIKVILGKEEIYLKRLYGQEENMAGSEELKKIKKVYGESFMKLCRSLFPTLLEQE